jgi:hypothetical protein
MALPIAPSSVAAVLLAVAEAPAVVLQLIIIIPPNYYPSEIFLIRRESYGFPPELRPRVPLKRAECCFRSLRKLTTQSAIAILSFSGTSKCQAASGWGGVLKFRDCRSVPASAFEALPCHPYCRH